MLIKLTLAGASSYGIFAWLDHLGHIAGAW